MISDTTKLPPPWTDISSHPQGTTDRTPKTWEAKFGQLRLIVTRHVHHHPDRWLARCEPFFILTELESTRIDEAVEEATGMLHQAVADVMAALERR